MLLVNTVGKDNQSAVNIKKKKQRKVNAVTFLCFRSSLPIPYLYIEREMALLLRRGAADDELLRHNLVVYLRVAGNIGQKETAGGLAHKR